MPERLKKLIGKTVEDVVCTQYGYIDSVCFHFTDGTTLGVEPFTSNYDETGLDSFLDIDLQEPAEK